MDLNNKSNLNQKTITTQNISITPNTNQISPINIKIDNEKYLNCECS